MARLGSEENFFNLYKVLGKPTVTSKIVAPVFGTFT
jgi:hypothetical protein